MKSIANKPISSSKVLQSIFLYFHVIQESVKHLKVSKTYINTNRAVDLVSRKYAKHVVLLMYSFACDNAAV